MQITAARTAALMLALGVALGGCATRESVRNAQASADMADHHAGAAQARADEAYGVGNQALGVGNEALGVGNDAKMAAMTADQKAQANAAEMAKMKRRIAYLEYKVNPHKKRHHVRHRKAHKTEQQAKAQKNQQQAKADNS